MTGAGQPPYPEIVLRATAGHVLRANLVGWLFWSAVAIAGLLGWFVLGSDAGVLLAVLAGWFAVGITVSLVAGVLYAAIRRRPVLVLGPHGVTLRTVPGEIPYDRVRLILTWCVVNHALETGPFHYLAVVPEEAIPAVYAAPRPRMPDLLGPYCVSGAPPVLHAWTVRIPGILLARRDEIVTELARRCPTARVEDLGDLPYAE